MLSWSGDGITLDVKEGSAFQSNVTVPADLYKLACVSNAEEAVAAVQRIGLPVMIKASEGGGGKGNSITRSFNTKQNKSVTIREKPRRVRQFINIEILFYSFILYYIQLYSIKSGSE